MSSELLFQLCLCDVPNIGNVVARILIDHYGSAKDIFAAPLEELERLDGIGRVRAKCIKQFDGFRRAENEMKFISQFGIRTLFIKDALYPQRLLHCYDPPILLFYKGNADLNAGHFLSIVGTRHYTSYGKQIVQQLVKDLSSLNITIVSGLAFGIDHIAHESCIQEGIRTLGVLAHGLDRIYPFEHRQLAKQMIINGGLLTEFYSKTKPDKHHFPSRNRIVAGISDATVVIETGVKGGSMITAELANGYNRDVFAYPGRIIDGKSEGCNFLIKKNKAVMITGAADIIELLGWSGEKVKAPIQRELFVDLDSNEQSIYLLLYERGLCTIDDLLRLSGLSSSVLAATILRLEIKTVIMSLPGKIYRLA